MQLIGPIISMFVPFVNGSSLWRAPRQQCNYDGIIQKYLMNITRCQILQKLALLWPGFISDKDSTSRVSIVIHPNLLKMKKSSTDNFSTSKSG